MGDHEVALEEARQVDDIPAPEIPTCVAMLDIDRRVYADIRDVELYQHQREVVQNMVTEVIGMPIHIARDGSCPIVIRLRSKMQDYMRTLVRAGVIQFDPLDWRWHQCYSEEDLL